MKVAFYIFAAVFLASTIFVAPFVQDKKSGERLNEQMDANTKLQKQLEDKSPKLDGFINQFMVAQEPGTTNSLIFLQVTVGNSGGSPSIAEEYQLKVTLTNKVSTNAEPIYFADEWKTNTYAAGKLYLIDLKRPQLISEKTSRAIQPGEAPRGWIAFRLNGVLFSQFKSTNVFLSFLDINGKRIIVTNEFWKGKPALETRAQYVTQTLPGSESLMIPIEPIVQTNAGWLPPELPPDCSNVVVGFGANGIVYSRVFAEISPETNGTKFAIKDLPDFFLKDLDKMPGYSPRKNYIWIRDSMSDTVGGKTVPYPIQPVVISNRLYVEVQIPFLNEKRKIVMSDAFDPELPIPLNWDRNYSTNYDANGGIFAYEVVNELTNPVLQVVYTAPNEVHVNGIFQVDAESILASFGQQPQLLTFTNKILDSTQGSRVISLQSQTFFDVLTIPTNASIASIGEMITNEFYKPIFPGQKAIFKYPSNRHLGVFADWLKEE